MQKRSGYAVFSADERKLIHPNKPLPDLMFLTVTGCTKPLLGVVPPPGSRLTGVCKLASGRTGAPTSLKPINIRLFPHEQLKHMYLSLFNHYTLHSTPTHACTYECLVTAVSLYPMISLR